MAHHKVHLHCKKKRLVLPVQTRKGTPKRQRISNAHSLGSVAGSSSEWFKKKELNLHTNKFGTNTMKSTNRKLNLIGKKRMTTLSAAFAVVLLPISG